MAAPNGLGEPVKLPAADLVNVDDHISLLPPLSRRGYGPGLILITPEDAPTYPHGGTVCVGQLPPPLLKWAEEGFAVIEIRAPAFTFKSTSTGTGAAKEVLSKAITALEACETYRDEDGIGLIGKALLRHLPLPSQSPIVGFKELKHDIPPHSLRRNTMGQMHQRHHLRFEDTSSRHLRHGKDRAHTCWYSNVTALPISYRWTSKPNPHTTNKKRPRPQDILVPYSKVGEIPHTMPGRLQRNR